MKTKRSVRKMNNGGTSGKPVAKAAVKTPAGQKLVPGKRVGYYVGGANGSVREVSQEAYKQYPEGTKQVLEKGANGNPIMPMSGGKHLKTEEEVLREREAKAKSAKKPTMKKGGTFKKKTSVVKKSSTTKRVIKKK